ncbi:unnamed protein product, partial [Meganyctiphanes norvegica]
MDEVATGQERTCCKKKLKYASKKQNPISEKLKFSHFPKVLVDGMYLTLLIIDDRTQAQTLIMSIQTQDKSYLKVAAMIGHRHRLNNTWPLDITSFTTNWFKLKDSILWIELTNSASDRTLYTVLETQFVLAKFTFLKIRKRYGVTLRKVGGHSSSTIFAPIIKYLVLKAIQRVVDFRSDTVTQPSDEMKAAMVAAPLGDDVFRDDPTALALEKKVAELLGKEAGLFVPTGTMGNLICVLTHCWERGSEVLLGNLSHIHNYEQGGISQLGGVHGRTISNKPDGTFCLDEMLSLVRGNDPHYPITKLVCIENTHNMCGGKALPIEWLDKIGSICNELKVPLHMDGARLCNAAATLNISLERLVRHCSSVSLCLSKGLGAPIGSVIVGNKDFIDRAIRLRKVLGGGMRQVGVLAAAGIYALDHTRPLLKIDHDHAKLLAQAVLDAKSTTVTVDLPGVHSNILVLQCDMTTVTPDFFCQRMLEVSASEKQYVGEAVTARIFPWRGTMVRVVTHCNLSREDIQLVAKKLTFVVKEFNK